MKKNCADGIEADTALRLVPKKAAEITTNTGFDAWALEPHVCKACFGRMASRPFCGDRVQLLCTNCGATSVQESITAACCCGLTVRKRNGIGRSGGPMIDAGIRCVENPARSPAFPSMYIAQEVVKKTKV